MASYSGLPLEIIEEIITALQGDIPALQACSQICSSLLPLCRKYIFRSIDLNRHSAVGRHSGPPVGTIQSFARLLDNNPGLSEYVQNLSYTISRCDIADTDVLWVLGRLHRLRCFRLSGGMVDYWNTIPPPFQSALWRLIWSVQRLEILYFFNFPMIALSHCLNLVDLSLTRIESFAVESYDEDASASMRSIPQLRSFALCFHSSHYSMRLLQVRRPNDVPVLDFSNIQKLTVNIGSAFDVTVAHAFIKATEKIETLEYTVGRVTNGFTGFAESISGPRLTTLKNLSFRFEFIYRVEDPFCGLCEELEILSGSNVIETFTLDARLPVSGWWMTGDEWARLDSILANEFPVLRHVLFKTPIPLSSSVPNELSGKYLPRLSENVVLTWTHSSE